MRSRRERIIAEWNGAAPPALGCFAHAPALPGWADVWQPGLRPLRHGHTFEFLFWESICAGNQSSASGADLSKDADFSAAKESGQIRLGLTGRCRASGARLLRIWTQPSRAGLTFSNRASGLCGADTHRLNWDSLLIPCSVYAKE